MSAATSGPPLPIWKKALYSVLVLITVVGSLEGICRLTGFGARPAVADYISNWQLQWNDDFYVVTPYPDSGINQDGMRDYEHSVANRDERIRIVCLGDSVTFGFELAPEESYPSILEQELQDQGYHAEVFNVALPGWSTRQERIAYHKIARKYKPDYVILGFCLNDVAEMQNNIRQPPGATTVLYDHSQLFRGLLRPESREIGRVEELFHAPGRNHIRRGWELCQAEILELMRDVRYDGGRFALLILPFRFQVSSRAPPPVAQKELVEFAAKHQFECVDALPGLRQVGTSAFIDHDHLSPKGGRIVGRELIQAGIFDFVNADDACR